MVVITTREQWPTGEDLLVALATSDSTISRKMPNQYRCLRCGDLRSPGVTEWRKCPFGLRDDDDNDDDDLEIINAMKYRR